MANSSNVSCKHSGVPFIMIIINLRYGTGNADCFGDSTTIVFDYGQCSSFEGNNAVFTWVNGCGRDADGELLRIIGSSHKISGGKSRPLQGPPSHEFFKSQDKISFLTTQLQHMHSHG